MTDFDGNVTEYTSSGTWYDPEMRRWLEPEPTGDDGPNLYHFVRNNPIFFFDPDGLQSQAGDPGVRQASYFDCFARCLEKHRCPLSGGEWPGMPGMPEIPGGGGLLVGVPAPKETLWPYKPPLGGSSPFTNPASSAALLCGIRGTGRRIISRLGAAPAFIIEAGWDISAECYCASKCLNNPYNY